MKRRSRFHALWWCIALAAFVAVGAFAFVFRTSLRETYREVTAPSLPQEERYTFIHVPDDEVAAVTDDALPTEKLLAVPFTSQAPQANWDMPYQEACEEASMLMVVGYYAGESGVIPVEEADARLLDLVAFEEEELSLPADITLAEAKKVIEAKWPALEAKVLPLEGADQIKRYVAAGIPVIVGADGKTLPNPNFRNGGPLYHMLVVRGYTATHFVTNDPGTRLGEKFLYTYDGLLDSVRDWNGGDVPHGARVILVVQPREE